MKLGGLVPFMYMGAIYIFPPSVLCGISIFLYCVRELSAQPCKSREKGRELPPSSVWCQFPALPSVPVVELRVHINDQHTNYHGKN